MARIEHWDSTTCPYAQRSWIALVEKGLDFEVKKVDLQNKSAEFEETYHSIFPDPAAPAKVPILIDGDVRLVESCVICEYLDQAYPTPPLLPSDAGTAARVRLFTELFSTHFTARLYGTFSAQNREQLDAAVEKLAAGLKVLDAFLRLHAAPTGLFLGDDAWSLAEVFTVSFLQRALVCLHGFRGVDLQALVDDNKLDRFDSWMHAALARPSAVQTRPADDVVLQGTRKYVAPFDVPIGTAAAQ